MAITDQIFEVRLRINDPQGFISFLSVAALPAAPIPQTAYLLTTDNLYYSTEKAIGAIPTDYTVEELLVSDARISTWIDAYGLDATTCKALAAITAQLRYQLQIKKQTAGADSTEYMDLKTVYEVYKDLQAQCSEQKKSNENNNSGRWLTSNQPTIAGGNL